MCFFNISEVFTNRLESQTFLNLKGLLSGTFKCSSRFKCINTKVDEALQQTSVPTSPHGYSLTVLADEKKGGSALVS